MRGAGVHGHDLSARGERTRPFCERVAFADFHGVAQFRAGNRGLVRTAQAEGFPTFHPQTPVQLKPSFMAPMLARPRSNRDETNPPSHGFAGLGEMRETRRRNCVGWFQSERREKAQVQLPPFQVVGELHLRRGGGDVAKIRAEIVREREHVAAAGQAQQENAPRIAARVQADGPTRGFTERATKLTKLRRAQRPETVFAPLVIRSPRDAGVHPVRRRHGRIQLPPGGARTEAHLAALPQQFAHERFE